jgi:hypothetical protein
VGSGHALREQDTYKQAGEDMTKIKCHVVRRKNKDGIPSVAPFINGWNVWDIPETQWNDTIGPAIWSAYRLGWEHALKEVRKVKCPGLTDWEGK